MKKLLTWLFPMVLLVACDDKDDIPPPEAHPEMHYTDLGNLSIKFGEQKSVDMDGDNTKEFLFSTVLVGDPIARVDKQRYFVTAAFNVSSLVNAEQTPALAKDDLIITVYNPGFNWYNANSIVLAEKIIEETAPEHWEGNWKNTDHKYFAVQVLKNNLRYNGWVELSFRTGTGEMILHRAAIAVEAEKNVKAGK
jgi:hypothetical protein